MMNSRIGQCRFLLPLLLLCLLTACGDLLFNEQRLMANAHNYLEERNITAAAIELRNVLQHNPDNAEARYLLAGISLDYGDYLGAEKEFRRAESAGWSSEQARIGVARAMLGMARFNDMIEATETEDNWSAQARADLLALRAAAEAGLGNAERASALIDQAAALEPSGFQVLKTAIQLKIINGQLDAAAAAITAALQKYPARQELLLLQGNVSMQQGDSPGAQRAFEQVISQDPAGFISTNGRSARLELAQLQILGRDYAGADASLRPLFAREPDDPYANYLGGMLAFHTGDFQRAEELLLKVLKLAPEHNPSRLLFGTVNFAEHNYEQAAYFLAKYLAAVPDNLAARKLLARSYILLNRANEARTVLQGVLDDDSADSELQILAGLSELERGETLAGIAGLERVLKADPRNNAVRTALARAYLDSGDTSMAVKELNTLLESGDSQQQTRVLLVHAHLKAGEFDAAISEVLDLLSKHPGEPLLQALAGTVFATSGDRAEARRYLLRAVEMKPDLPPAIMALAHLDELEGDYAAAEKGYRRLVDMEIESALPMLALARVAEERGDQQAMVEWLERASEHAPGDVKPRIFLARYFLNHGLPERAHSLLEAALLSAPREPVLLSLYGKVLMVQQQYQAALTPLTTLVNVAPDSISGRVQLADAYINLRHYDDARKELQTAYHQDANSVAVLALLVKLELLDGELARAREYSTRLRLGYPELYLGYELSGDVLMTAGEFAAAEQQYAQAGERLASAGLAIKRAENAVRSGNTAAATGFLQDWLADHPDDVRVAQYLGVVWENMQQDALAIKQYERVLELQPDNVVALNNLAGLYRSSNPSRALSLAEKAYRAAPDNPGVQDTYGWLLVNQGYPERGLRMLEHAVKALGEVPEVRYHYAAAQVRGGDRSAGRQLLEKLLEEGVPFEGSEAARQLLDNTR